MPEKLYMMRTRYANLAKYHLDLLKETMQAGPVEKGALGPSGLPLPKEWIHECDCYDLSLQCTLFCAFGIEHEGVTLMQMTDEQLLHKGDERRAFKAKYLKEPDNPASRTKVWKEIRNALEMRLAHWGCKLPDFDQVDSERDELDALMDARNMYAHGKAILDPKKKGLFHLNPLWAELKQNGDTSDWSARCQRWLILAQEHWEITESVYEVYLEFWRQHVEAHGGPPVVRRF